MLVFAAETSCDETSICLMKDREILEHLIYSQEIHKNFGGVVPELASRSHLEKLQEMTRKLIKLDDSKKIGLNVFQETDLFSKLCKLASFGLFKAAEEIEEAETG